MIVRSIVLCLVLTPALAWSQTNLVVSEIMYNTPGPDDIEYIELFNASPDSQLDLAGWSLVDDNPLHTPVPLVGVLEPEGVLVVAGDIARFSQQYPGVTNVNPNQFEPEWQLGNAGDAVNISNASSQLVVNIVFTDLEPWPIEADGGGPALELIDPAQPNGAATNWRAGPVGGSPGTYAGAQPVELGTWGAIKSLYR